MTTTELAEVSRPRITSRPLMLVGRALAYVVVIIALWWAYVTIANVPQYLLPSPGAVGEALVGLTVSGELWVHLGYTLRNIALGFIGGVVIGCGLGYVLWRSRWARDIANPYILVLQAAPKIAIAPLLVLWFGLGLESQLVLILTLTFFPMMIAMQLGLSSTPPAFGDLGRILGVGRGRYFFQFQLPHAMPELFAGAKIAIVDAMTGAFLAEFISAQEGLGYLMVLGNTSYNSSLLIAAVIVTIVTGLAGFGVISFAERRILRWRAI
ncbi:ABC transporter permease [Microbacterium sp. SORGH_AS_0862]|uniref:ABC transporter permease n=1 Tax=Microbacterium sp. SORGH_AS_0862 TaxID=3041789 RepID=UPI00278F3970|nr:ABC transporter permease [Microbacterium sp. SORGH_AS_0862]MDQ1205276.1 NitT/TauT family transport system permease protein [Microbacterium sp. SORGH_AS_0862]